MRRIVDDDQSSFLRADDVVSSCKGTIIHSEREIGNGSEMPDLGGKLGWI
jgi:hypothetical protein